MYIVSLFDGYKTLKKKQNTVLENVLQELGEGGEFLRETIRFPHTINK